MEIRILCTCARHVAQNPRQQLSQDPGVAVKPLQNIINLLFGTAIIVANRRRTTKNI